MNHLIVLDEETLKELVECNIFQSRQFDPGEALADCLLGEQSVEVISPRIVPTWKKNSLYLLQSRSLSAYLVIDSAIFESLPEASNKAAFQDDVLTVFQKICRFAIKEWKGLSFSFSEMWSTTTDCGVVFPYPKSKNIAFRVTLKVPESTNRLQKRHGSRQIFAFAAGYKEEESPSEDQLRRLKRAFDELGAIRTSLDVHIRRIEAIPSDEGYHPLILAAQPIQKLQFQSYNEWLDRLTKSQKSFVTYSGNLPQRVEGAAGTGKTLCLLLRAYWLCKEAESESKECRVIFIAHSDATKHTTIDALLSLGEPHYHLRNRHSYLQTIELYTLQEWCGKILGAKELGEAQYLDQDALSAKELRKLLLKEIIERQQRSDLKVLSYLTEEFREFFTNENVEYLSELLQHEIGVMIKGRAGEDLESYLALPMLQYCLPTRSSNDRRLVYSVYREYQCLLNESGVYDTDDIVLSTLGRLNTPIWRRRRVAEGFDYVVVDETHLFNFNELSVFHYLLRSSSDPKITFSIDRSQAPGNRGITSELVREVLMNATGAKEVETRTDVVFRSSPSIIRLAEAITSSGAMLFTAFENPLMRATSVITASDEMKAGACMYWEVATDDEMLPFCLKRAAQICRELKCKKSDILIVAMTESVLRRLVEFLNTKNEAFFKLAQRSDIDTVKEGLRHSAYIISHPDYVGGLEFQAVLILGVSDGEVPPTEGVVKDESRHFIEFKACNRLYVAISRARLVAELFYSRQRGRSKLLEHAIQSEAVTVKRSDASE